jgi:two-component system chemotaxis response regulator CheB
MGTSVTHRDVVAVGASAGGVEALRALVGGLPADLPAAVLLVLHVPRDSTSALPAILSRSGPLPAALAADGEPLRPGRIYIAPADRHLLVLDDRLRLSRGPSENGHRPAVDPLFRSVARAAGRRAVCVVLSGARDDGAVGAYDVASRGGLVVVQDPADALFPPMPQAVLARVTADHVVPAATMGGLISELVSMPIPDHDDPPPDPRLDDEVAISDFARRTTDQTSAVPAGYGCPDCGGGLFLMTDDPAPHYRCRVGHAWSPESLLDEQAVATEGALWTALRALEEKAALSRRMATKGAAHTYGDRYLQMADDADGAVTLIRQLIEQVAGRHGRS